MIIILYGVSLNSLSLFRVYWFLVFKNLINQIDGKIVII